MTKQTKPKVTKAPAYLRFRPGKEGRRLIYIDIISERKHHYRSLGLFLLPETTAKSKRENAKTLREANRQLQEEIERIISSKVKPSEKLLLSSWISTIVDRNRGKKIEFTYRSIERMIKSFFPSVLLEEAGKDFCVDFMTKIANDFVTYAGRNLTGKGVKNFCNYLSICFDIAVEERLIAENPWKKVHRYDKPKFQMNEREFLTLEEVDRLVRTECKYPAIRQAFLFACFTGLRRGDVARLKWSDISETDGRKCAHIIMEKTGKPLTIPLSKKALSYLPEHQGNEKEYVFAPFDNNHLGDRIMGWIKAAEIKKAVTFHVARHTFATMMITLGVDLYTVSKLLGHTSISSTLIYARMVDKVKDAAISTIDSIDWQPN